MGLDTRFTLVIAAKTIAALLMLFVMLATLVKCVVYLRHSRNACELDAETLSADSGNQSENGNETIRAGGCETTPSVGIIGGVDGPTTMVWPNLFAKKKNRDHVVLSEAEATTQRVKFFNDIISLEFSEQSARFENQTGETDGDTTFLRITLHASDVERIKSALESPRMSETKPDKTLSAEPPGWWPKENVIASAASSEYLLGETPMNLTLARSGEETVLCIALPSDTMKLYKPREDAQP